MPTQLSNDGMATHIKLLAALLFRIRFPVLQKKKPDIDHDAGFPVSPSFLT